MERKRRAKHVVVTTVGRKRNMKQAIIATMIVVGLTILNIISQSGRVYSTTSTRAQQVLFDIGFAGPDPRTSTTQPDSISRSITSFPDFMTQETIFVEPLHLTKRTCDVTDPSLPGFFEVSNFPKSYPPTEFITQMHGDFREVWASSKAPPSTEFDTVGCSFKQYKFANHFPHSMQHILQCWSLWNHFPNATHIMMVGEYRFSEMLKNSAFNRAITHMLHQNNITIIHSRPKDFVRDYPSDQSKLLVSETSNLDHYRMANTNDMQHFKQKVIDSIPGYTAPATSCSKALIVDDLAAYTNANSTQSKRAQLSLLATDPQPRIVILSRQRHRRLMNVTIVSTLLKEHFDLTYQPPVIFFEGVSFEQQAEAFANVDILVTPHGAQCTGLFLMPRCGSLIEIFPHGYGIPNFFGTLSSLSGINHSHVYLGVDIEAETAEGHANAINLNQVRGVGVCVPMKELLKAVTTEINNWKSCCGLV